MLVNHTLIGLIAIVPKTGFVYIEDLEVTKDQEHHHYGSILVTFACWLSLKYQDGGYVSLLTKTNGVEQFYKKLGAQFITNQNCYFSGKVAKELISKYEPKGGFKVEKQ